MLRIRIKRSRCHRAPPRLRRERLRQEHLLPKLLRRDTRTAWEAKGSKTATEAAWDRVRDILAKHQPRELDPALEKDLQDYVKTVRQRTEAEFLAAEWEE